MAKKKTPRIEKLKLPGRLAFDLPGRYKQGILTQPTKRAGRATLTGEKIIQRTKELAEGRKITASQQAILQREQQKIAAQQAQKLAASEAAAARPFLQRLPGMVGRGLLGVGRFAGPVGLGLTGAYYGARALGYDPFGMNTPEKGPSPKMYQAPAKAADPRFMQVINPGYESTGKEVLNAALLRAGLRLAGGGNLRETIDAAASVADSQNIFRTGQEALAAGKRNLGDAAKVYVQQNKDGTWTYTGSIDADPMAKMKAIFGDDKKIITKDILETAKRANPGKTDKEVIAGLIASGFTQGAETVT